MLNKQDQLYARFAPGDAVQFGYRDWVLKGRIIRMNPTRAVVRVDSDDFNVPYERLLPKTGKATERVQRIETIFQLAQELMAQHGLKDWTFKFDHSTRRAGCCSFCDKTISIAFGLARSANDADIRDTLLHEIAHALVGKKHPHDAVWKAQAKAIGCSGERTHRLQFSPPRWTVTCENRCWTHVAQQRDSRLICKTCGGKLIYTPFSTTA